MYVVFARKYRPERFEQVIGQGHITRTLQNAVAAGRIAQAYLFCGSRGVGKTTVARILAKALNCKQGPTPDPCCECTSCRRIARGDDIDVLEIDGASNNSVEDVRELRQNVSLAPAHSRYKLYYIDEVHMLSNSAFNALLKTLEEPPEHVKFIFSTTEPQDMPETVRSRCQRFDFRRVPDRALIDMLREVCEKEGLQVEEGGAAAIARAARGSVRDALSALDQLAVFGDQISMQDVHSVLGTVDRTRLSELVEDLAAEDTAAALTTLDELLLSGTDVEDFADQFGQYLRDVLVAAYCPPDAPVLAGAAADAETLKRQTELFSPEQLTYMIQLLREAKLSARRDTTGRIALELTVIRMSRLSDLVPLAEAMEDLRSSDPGPGNPGEGAGAAGTAAAAEAPGGQDATQEEGPPGGKKARAAALRSLEGIKEKLNNHGRRRGNGGRQDGVQRGADRPGAPVDDVPEGIDETKYRRLVNSADEPQTAREALQDEPLLNAFLQADEMIGLNPLKVEKLARQSADDEEPDEEPGSEEG